MIRIGRDGRKNGINHQQILGKGSSPPRIKSSGERKKKKPLGRPVQSLLRCAVRAEGDSNR